MFIGVVSSVLLMHSRRATSVIMGLVRIVICSALEMQTGSLEIGHGVVLAQLPMDIRTILTRFDLVGKTITYATCPVCHYTYKPTSAQGIGSSSYPRTCNNRRRPDSTICGASLVREREIDGNIIQTPIKPFLYHSVLDFIGMLSSRKEFERHIDKACDDCYKAMKEGLSQNQKVVSDVFQAEFFRSFRGPRPQHLFVDRQDEGRFAFNLNVDFFNTNGNRVAGAAASCGIITLTCLNLPPKLRYRYENMHVAGIIPGPREPELESINHFLRPLIDDMVDLWDPGVRLSRTAMYRAGRLVRAAIVCVVCDLPAARKVAALANHRSDDFLCSICTTTREDLRNGKDKEVERNATVMRNRAEAWKGAKSSQEQDSIFHSAGVRYTELWRLTYWDPTKQLVVDPMHNLLLGIVQDHFRTLLPLASKTPKSRKLTIPRNSRAFIYDFLSVPSIELQGQHPIHTPGSREYMNGNEIKDVSQIHKELTSPIDFDSSVDPGIRVKALEAFAERLARRYRAKAIQFVCKSLDIPPDMPYGESGNRPRQKIHWTRPLAIWVSA